MAVYLRAPNYVNNLKRLGFTDDDVADGASERLVDAIVVCGDVDAAVGRIKAHLDAGADHVCAQLLTHDAPALPEGGVARAGRRRRRAPEGVAAMGIADVDNLSKVDTALLFARLDRIAAALRESNNDLFDSGGDPGVYKERRDLRAALEAIDTELQGRTWPASEEGFVSTWEAEVQLL